MIIKTLFIFNLDQQKYAVDLFCIVRTIQAIEINKIPENRDLFLGIINIHGKIIPVVNIRKKFDLPDREISVDDVIVILTVSHWQVAVVIDSVDTILDIADDEIIQRSEILPHLATIEGVIKIKGDIILLHDLQKIFSLEDKAEIKSLLEAEKC